MRRIVAWAIVGRDGEIVDTSTVKVIADRKGTDYNTTRTATAPHRVRPLAFADTTTDEGEET